MTKLIANHTQGQPGAPLLLTFHGTGGDEFQFHSLGQHNPDYHILHSEYHSGMGGGESRTWKVPKDPQAYARLFIPKDKDK